MKGQFLICFLIQLVLATGDPERCCTPDQFQISYGGTVGQVIDKKPVGLREFFNGAFDFKNKQYGMDVYIHNYTDGSDLRYKIYQLANKGTEYVVVNSVCVKIPVGPLPTQCVPDSVTCVSSEFLGDQVLLLDSWKQTGSSAGFEGDAYATTARKNCVPGPLSAVGSMDAQGQKVYFMNSGTYMNFTNSIAEPDYWFVPPASCSNATKKIPDFWFHPLFMGKRLRATSLIL